jgi:elongation factor 1-gamma
LYTAPGVPRSFKALIAAQYNDLKLELLPDFEFGKSNKTPEFLKKFPLGKTPTFESTDGSVLLCESNAIAYYGE